MKGSAQGPITSLSLLSPLAQRTRRGSMRTSASSSLRPFCSSVTVACVALWYHWDFATGPTAAAAGTTDTGVCVAAAAAAGVTGGASSSSSWHLRSHAPYLRVSASCPLRSASPASKLALASAYRPRAKAASLCGVCEIVAGPHWAGKQQAWGRRDVDSSASAHRVHISRWIARRNKHRCTHPLR